MMPRLNIDDLSSELEKLDGQDGITPEAVVGVARDPSNVLHAHFEWDVAKAGQAGEDHHPHGQHHAKICVGQDCQRRGGSRLRTHRAGGA